MVWGRHEDSEVETRERTDSQGNRVLDVFVISTVKKGFARVEFDGELRRAPSREAALTHLPRTARLRAELAAVREAACPGLSARSPRRR